MTKCGRLPANTRSTSGPTPCWAGPARLDSNRIVRETVHALEGLAMGVELADPAGLDPAEAAEWAASMAQSIRLLSKFLRQVKEAIR